MLNTNKNTEIVFCDFHMRLIDLFTKDFVCSPEVNQYLVLAWGGEGALGSVFLFVCWVFFFFFLFSFPNVSVFTVGFSILGVLFLLANHSLYIGSQAV